MENKDDITVIDPKKKKNYYTERVKKQKNK